MLSAREAEGRDGVESGTSSNDSLAPSWTVSGGRVLLLEDECCPMSFCRVLCESEVSSLVAFSSGVVGLEE